MKKVTAESRNILKCTLVLLAVGLLTMPWNAHALGRGGHAYMAQEAAVLVDVDYGAFPALETHIEWVAEHGARHEDEYDHIWDGNNGAFVTCTHFWDADDADLHQNYYFATHGWCGNAYMKSNELLDALFASYFSQDWYQFWEYLGHIAHLIGDMTVPAHAHVDYHMSFDSYDDGWIGWDCEGACPPPNYRRYFSAWDGFNAGGLVEIPESAIQWIIDNNEAGGFGLGANPRTFAQLYYLMYTAAQTGDYFASDDYNGSVSDRHGWMDYTGWPSSPVTTDDLDDNWWYEADLTWVFSNHDDDYTRIGQTAYVYGIRAVATMYMAFREAFDAVPPTTTAHLTYAVPPNEGWTMGDVTMVLEAEDNLADGPFGVYHSYWSEGSGIHEYTDPVVFTEEGIHDIEYWSVDNFGNVEDRQMITIRIDKTGPEVHDTSPEADGFYLTSGTLTIDWTVTDELSGVDWATADIDGQDVLLGQVLDLDAMGGWHTFTLRVGDVAGNVTVESFDFSIKIHALVDFKPDKFNLKSSGNPVTVYIQFPTGYDVELIDVSTVTLIPTVGWFLPAHMTPTEVKDFIHDKVPDRMVQFSRPDTSTALTGIVGHNEITVIGNLYDNTEFYGTEIIEVTEPGGSP